MRLLSGLIATGAVCLAATYPPPPDWEKGIDQLDAPEPQPWLRRLDEQVSFERLGADSGVASRV